MPAVAAIEPAIKLFQPDCSMAFRVKIRFQCRKVILSRVRPLPMFMVIDVVATVRNGKTTIIKAKALISIVNKRRHLPKSTILGRVDFPETVIYCFFPITKVEK
jgi:hypothetical protein